MNVLVIDGQGGKVGGQIAAMICENYPDVYLMAVGTNTTATSNMIKNGTRHAATGENALIVACRKADVIIGPLGIVIADALYGEVTPKMALAVAQSDATRILIPFSTCDTFIAGLPEAPLSDVLNDALEKFGRLYRSK